METQLINQQTTLLTKALQIDALTDRMLRIHSSSHHPQKLPTPHNTISYAIENLPENTGKFCPQNNGCYDTGMLQIQISSQDHISISSTDGRMLCEDYSGDIATKENLSAEERDLMAQEGHSVPDSDIPRPIRYTKKYMAMSISMA